MNKIIDNIKSGNYEVVDNQGVSVTENFTQCLEKEFADLETKLADLQQEQIKEMQEHQEAMKLADKTIKDTEEQNKRVLEKLELIVSANQELEQKLAESEKSEETYKSMFEIGVENNHSLLKEIEQLKQQLADTETQNKRVLEKLELIVSANQELEQKLAVSKNSLKRTIEHYEKYCSEINHQNVMLYASACNAQQASRDKISFCIGQLEKVKEFNIQQVFSSKPLDNFIDNQIKQLKEMK